MPHREKTRILLVDDVPENLLALEALIRRDDVVVHKAASGDAALELLLAHDFALAILDVQMPGMDGFELAEFMRGTEKTKHIPIVFVTAGGRELNYAFKGYESGAVDFLHKPLDAHTVKSKVNVFVDLYRQSKVLKHQLETLERHRQEQEALLQELTETQEELRKAITIRDEFMSIASHELKTPLTSLKLQIQLRQRYLKKGDASAFTIDKIAKMVESDDRQIQRLIRLIDDMLDISRIRSGRLTVHPATFDLSELVRDVVDRFSEQLAAAGCTVTLTVPGPVVGYWDHFRVEQVVINLLTNAMRYGAGKPVTIVLEAGDGRARLSVRDEGIGIAEEHQARIFQQFERVVSASQIGGLGLGLYIVDQIVRAHGGSIRVESALGKGSTFIVELPVEGNRASDAS